MNKRLGLPGSAHNSGVCCYECHAWVASLRSWYNPSEPALCWEWLGPCVPGFSSQTAVILACVTVHHQQQVGNSLLHQHFSLEAPPEPLSVVLLQSLVENYSFLHCYVLSQSVCTLIPQS